MTEKLNQIHQEITKEYKRAGNSYDMKIENLPLTTEEIFNKTSEKIDKNPRAYFFTKRNKLNYTDMFFEMYGEIIKSIIPKNIYYELGLSFLIWDMQHIYIERGIKDKLYPNTNVYTFSNLLKDLNIKHYSIPYGTTRTIENNENGEVLTHCADCVAGWGVAVVKGKKSTICVKITKCDEVGNATKVIPISPSEAKELMQRFEDKKNFIIKADYHLLDDLHAKEVFKKV